MFKQMVACVLVCFSWIRQPALAAEGAVYGGPIGGTDIQNAYVPPFPGMYAGFANVFGVITQYNGNNGGKSAVIRDVNLGIDITAVGLTYVYPFKLFGATLSSGLQEAYYPYYRFSFNNKTERLEGWGDLYIDLAKWTKSFATLRSPRAGASPLPYGLVAQIAYSMIFPIGRYNTNQFATPGHNTYYIIPNVALTYLTSPNFIGDGVELSGHVFYDDALRNRATDYHSGGVLDLDWGITERSGRLQYGIVGSAASQIQNDTVHGRVATTNGNRLVDVEAGPVVALSLPKVGLFLKTKVLWDLYARNHLNGPQMIFEAGFKL